MSSVYSSQTSIVSRLRRGGLVLAATAVAAAVPLMTANAQVVNSTQSYSVTAPPPNSGTTNITEVNVDNAGGNEFGLVGENEAKGGGVKYQLKFNGEASAFNVVVPSAGSSVMSNVGNGFSVNAGDTFSNSIVAFIYNSGGQWAAGADQYFGFEFNPSSSLELYGWGELALASDLSTLTLVQYAYDSSGSAILTPAAPTAVPEPGSIALLVGMATAGAGFLRHKRKGSVKP